MWTQRLVPDVTTLLTAVTLSIIGNAIPTVNFAASVGNKRLVKDSGEALFTKLCCT